MPFREAIEAEPSRLAATATGQHRVFSYVDRGIYSAQIERILARFPVRQLLVLRTEDLRHRHADTLREVFRFLDVDASYAPEADTVFSGSYPEMDDGCRELLQARFDGEIRTLERLLGRDCPAWRAGPAPIDH